MRKWMFGTALLVMVLSGCSGTKRVEWSQPNIQSFVTYYGKDVNTIDSVDVAFIDTRNIAGDLKNKKKIVKNLKSKGMYIFAYVAVGEDVKDYNPKLEMKPYYYDADKNGIPDLNPSWGSILVNANNPEWQAEVMKRIQSDAIDCGADGIFMDQIDTGPPEPKEGLELIRNIHQKYPDLKLVANQGLNILDDTAPIISGLMLESFSSTWLTNDSYAPIEGEVKKANAWIGKRLNEVRQKHPFPVFVIDYAKPNDKEIIQQSVDRAWAFDFVPYISTRLLDKVYLQDIKPTVKRGSLVGHEMKEYGDLPEPRHDPANIALAENGTTVKVDSSYANYKEKPLNDGYRQKTALVWSEIAWASEVKGENHWVELTFPKPKKPKKVDIYWALDNGEYKTSQEVSVQVKKDGEWTNVAKITETEGNKPMSSVNLPDGIETDSIRIFQDFSMGPTNYVSPNIMWISEIEVYE